MPKPMLPPSRAGVPTLVLCALLSGCGGGDGGNGDSSGSGGPPTPAELAAACPTLADAEVEAALPVAKTDITAAELVAATDSAPEHCRIDGEINRRTGIDSQSYAIAFRLRMPTAAWNGRFFMGGGGGTNGTLVDPTAQLALGYATIGTDSGHSNATNSVAEAGGSVAFGVDPQARVDFAYNAYDKVTQVGKALVERFYGQAPKYAYFMGCSEGGREGMLMTQRFPEHYDGVIAGDPVIRIALSPMAGIYTTQLFGGLAQRSALTYEGGIPAINKTYSDTDLLLIRNAVLDACDALDGLEDGIVDNLPACTTDKVSPALAQLQCTGEKDDSCLTADQIETMKVAYAGPVNSKGAALYTDWQWDGGIGGKNGESYNPSWRSWWLGSYASASNNATKLVFAGAQAVVYSTPPVLPMRSTDTLAYSMAYDFDTDPLLIYATTPEYPQSSASMLFTDSLDLSRFRDRGGKLMVYHGASDASVSINDTLHWYDAMNAAMGSNAQEFARMYPVPGMGHCSGGPATDKFDMLPQLVDWVEKGIPPDSVLASATNPGYFGVASRTRPLCPYPKQARYDGSGDVNDAANFSCR